MLHLLFGCKSIERILLYLLVNETCYAHQLHRILNTPLTPIQNALKRLELGNVVKSNLEGKARVYQFNLEYPLINELELLLKKAFHQLPPHEKKIFYYFKPLKAFERKQQHELLEVTWNHLKSISNVTLIAKSHSKQMNGWVRKGSGEVIIKEEGSSLIFAEQGHWKDESGNVYNFSNCFRWTLNRIDRTIGLEHLRFGKNNPVFLFHLIPKTSHLLESLHSHLCGEDTYFGRLQYSDLFLQLHFRTLGPKKNEEIEYIYTT